MKSVRFLVFRVFSLIALLTTCLYFLYGQEREQGIPIARNAAWNDLVRQIGRSMDDSPHETLGKEIVLIQEFLKRIVLQGKPSNRREVIYGTSNNRSLLRMPAAH